MPDPSLRVTLLPKDTGGLGNIFGGVILSYIDLAGAVEARKHGARLFVTRAMKEVEFIAPVRLGDIVSLYTETLKVGRTSVTVKVMVETQRGLGLGATPIRVTEAVVTYVAVDPQGRPIPVKGREST